MQELTEPGFAQKLAKEECAAVLFWAVWCPHCHAQSAVLGEIEGEFPHVLFAKVNTENEPRLAEKYRIRSIPTLLFFRHGEEVLRLCGFHKAKEISERLEKIRPVSKIPF